MDVNKLVKEKLEKLDLRKLILRKYLNLDPPLSETKS